MKTEVMERCALFVSNRKDIDTEFILENKLFKTIAAYSFAERNRKIDIESIKEARKVLRQKQGAFSFFRGNNEFVIATKMALSGNPERYIDDVARVYDMFQEGKFWGSTYRVLASLTICDTGRASEAAQIIEKTNEIIKGMKDKHPFLTSDEDTCTVVLLAMKDQSVESILAELEETYEVVKKNFTFHENAAYSLCQVLTAYEGGSEDKCKKTLDIFEGFKKADVKYGKNYELAALGTLAKLNMSADEIVAEVVEVNAAFKGHSGFGMLEMNAYTKLMFAAMVVVGACSLDDGSADAAAISGTVARVVAEEVAMMTAICAAGSIAASSSSSSN